MSSVKTYKYKGKILEVCEFTEDEEYKQSKGITKSYVSCEDCGSVPFQKYVKNEKNI